ncbi:MAG: NAD(P)H-hydrate epimerase [Phycisphaerales bacterium]
MSDEPATSHLMLTRAAARRLDREALERYAIPGIVLMENAARGAAGEALAMLRQRGIRRAVLVCGEGNNGGDGWAMARHLHNASIDVEVIEVAPSRPGSDAAINREICRRMGLAITGREQLDAIPSNAGAIADALVVDAVLGTGLTRAAEGDAAVAIAAINRCGAAGAPVLAIDLPSGLDADSGEPLGEAVRATTTVTFVAAKAGLLVPTARPFVGRLVVADIGAPRELVERLAVRRVLPSPPSRQRPKRR